MLVTMSVERTRLAQNGQLIVGDTQQVGPDLLDHRLHDSGPTAVGVEMQQRSAFHDRGVVRA